MTVEEERVLLPQQLYPTEYNITLTPDLTRFTFDGKVCAPSHAVLPNPLSQSSGFSFFLCFSASFCRTL